MKEFKEFLKNTNWRPSFIFWGMWVGFYFNWYKSDRFYDNLSMPNWEIIGFQLDIGFATFSVGL